MHELARDFFARHTDVELAALAGKPALREAIIEAGAVRFRPMLLTALAVLLLVETFADKIPAVNHLNDLIQTLVRPTAVISTAQSHDSRACSPRSPQAMLVSSAAACAKTGSPSS